MIGAGSLAHNRRAFVAENVDRERVHLNIKYCDENLKTVYHELFDQAVERYNEGKRNDRKITDYYEKIRQGKQEKLFHEVIFQIGNNHTLFYLTYRYNLGTAYQLHIPHQSIAACHKYCRILPICCQMVSYVSMCRWNQGSYIIHSQLICFHKALFVFFPVYGINDETSVFFTFFLHFAQKLQARLRAVIILLQFLFYGHMDS